MKQFYKFITRRSCVAQHVSSVSPPINRSKQLHWGPLVLPLAGNGWSGLAGYNRPDHDQQCSSRCLLTVETEAPNAVECS